MDIRSVSPQEAHDLLVRDPGYVYLDVRSIGEFAESHAPQALNIPLMHRELTGQMIPNPEFLAVVQANFPPESRLLVGCLSGSRSLKAVEILQDDGYTNVVNIRCGFGGARDASGGIVERGWAALGLPVEREPRAGASYEALKGKVRP